MLKILLLLWLCAFLLAVSAETFVKEYTENGQFIVPLGVMSVTISIEGASTGASSAGFATQATLAVLPNSVLDLVVGGASSTCGGEATSVLSSDVVLLLAAGGYTGGGNDFVTTASTSGEGADGVCGASSYYGYAMTDISTQVPVGNAFVRFTWEAVCSEMFDILHSDYDPTLLSTSSLYLVNGVPKLQLDVGLPIYYYDVTFDFQDQCGGELPVVTSEVIGCYNHFYTTIDYDAHCTFEYMVDPADPDVMLFEGLMRVNSSLQVEIDADWTIERDVMAPINWQVRLERLITVESVVAINNTGQCVDSAGCNFHGCCVEGVCDCLCDEFASGYHGTYCEIDETPPECVGFVSNFEVISPRGGCVNLGPSGTGALPQLPNIWDNSGYLSTFQRIWYHDTVQQSVTDLLEADDQFEFDACLKVGTHSFTYYGEDAADFNVSCLFEVNVIDAGKPEVDCGGCQDGTTESTMNLCVGTSDPETPYVKVEIQSYNYAYYMSLFYSNGRYIDYLPGRMIDMTEDWGQGNLVMAGNSQIFLDCDCQLDATVTDTAEHWGTVTNAWNSWGIPIAVDVADGDGVVVSQIYPDPSDVLGDGIYDVLYGTQDSDGFRANCSIRVTYDITPPSCDGWELTVGVDSENTNYTVPIAYPESIPGLNADISGYLDEYLYPPRAQDDVYYVGYAIGASYISTYSVWDNAGNVGTCQWKLIIENPNPCVWPVCGDVEPWVVSCPSSFSIPCVDTEACDGCATWTEPVFEDDIGVTRIKQSHAPGDILHLGITNVKYEAFDRFNQSAVCEFSILIVDNLAPVWDDCPTDTTVYTGDAYSYNYTYDISATDSCPLNTAMNYGTTMFPVEASLGLDFKPEGVEDLSVGDHYFRFHVTDSSDHRATCSWVVTVVDDHAPEIQCPADIVVRIADLELNFTQVNFAVMVSDNRDDFEVSYSHMPNHFFFEGTTTVTVVVTDSNNLTDTCQFDVIVLPPYDVMQFDAVLIKSVVREISPGEFGADLVFQTRVTPYFRLFDPLSLTSLATTDPREATGDCALDDTFCFQTWKVTVLFDSCQLDDFGYHFKFTSACLPADCSLTGLDYDVVISLTAENFCWQNLADVVISATMSMYTRATHDQYLADFDVDALQLPTSDFYFPKQVHYNDEEVAGIIEVTSASVFTSSVTILNVLKEFYSDAEMTNQLQSASLGSDATPGANTFFSRADFASFYYNEDQIPTGATYYVKYVAQVEIEYDLGARRRLLQVEYSEGSESNNELSEATALFLSEPMSVSHPDDGVVVLSLSSCDESTLTEVFVAELKAKMSLALRISEARMYLQFNVPGDSTCLMQITFAYDDCVDRPSLPEIFGYLDRQHGKPDSELHTGIDDMVDNTVTLNPDVYFIEQFGRSDPQTLTDTVGASDDEDTLSEDVTLNVIISVIALLVGAVATTAFYKTKQEVSLSHKASNGGPVYEADIVEDDIDPRLVITM